MRRLHRYLDAELLTDPTGDGVELRYSYNGERTYRRRCATRAIAVQEATERRADLERSGWVFHW